MVIPRLLNEIVEGLKNRDEVEAVVLGGSRGEGILVDQDSDWDLYIYGTASVDLEFRRQLLAPRTTLLELNNHFREAEDDGELNDGTVFELVYRNLDEFLAPLTRIIEGAEASVGYSTCSLHHLLNSHILFDRGNRFGNVKLQFAGPFPESLKRAIIAKNWPLLNQALPNFRSQAASAVKRGDQIAVQHFSAAFLASAFDVVFAANGVPHPGEKHLLERSSRLSALPSDWGHLLAAVDRTSQGSKGGLVAALDGLAGAVEVFLIRQGLIASPEAPHIVSKVAAPPPSAFAGPQSSGVLTVYTDGGCVGNPGKGAWAYLVDDGGLRTEDTGGEPLTTNNKMELQAVIEALVAIAAKPEWRGREVKIHTDSQYVRNGITTWIKNWASNGWKTAAKEPVKNQDLWMELQKWDNRLKPEWKWVKGHAGNPNNERCDALVRRTMEQM